MATAVNQTVISKKFGKGIITKIITKSTGYVEVKFENGKVRKEMAFNLTDESGKALRKAPKSSAVEKTVSPLQAAINFVQWVNKMVQGDRNGAYTIWEDSMLKVYFAAKEQGNDFIMSVYNSVDKYMKASDKQAYCLAKFAVDNNITL